MSALSHFFAELIARYGIPALFVSVTLETLGAPLPGKSALIIASAAAAAGKLGIWSVVITAFVAAVLGDNIGYLLGRRLGRPVVTRYGSRFGLNDRNFDRVEAVTARWGPLMVLVARFVPLLRQLNGLVAGTTRMAWPRFALANAAGAALWVGVWTTIAYRFGHHPGIVPYLLHHLTWIAAVLVPLLIAALVWLKSPPRPGRGRGLS